MDGRYGTVALWRLEVGGPVIKAIVALAVLALAIIGLAGVFSWLLASVATIALGAAFVFESGAVGKRFLVLAEEAWGGVTAGFPAGCVGVALGILSLLSIGTTVLVPVAIIVYGAAFLIESRTRFVLRGLESEHAGLQGMSLKVAKESAWVVAATLVLVGLGAIILGSLSITRIVPATLSLAALLAMGATVAFFSSPIGRFSY